MCKFLFYYIPRDMSLINALHSCTVQPIVQRIVHGVQHTAQCIVQGIVYGAQCIVHRAQCTVGRLRCRLCIAGWCWSGSGHVWPRLFCPCYFLRPSAAGGENAAWLLSVCRKMPTREQMWATFKGIDRRLRSLRALLKHFELQEGIANAGALRAEAKMRELGHKKRTLDLEYAEASQWFRSVVRIRQHHPRYTSRLEEAHKLLRDIHHDVATVCKEARLLDDTRNRLVDEEERLEMGEYSLSSGIEKLECDLAAVIAAGYDSD